MPASMGQMWCGGRIWIHMGSYWYFFIPVILVLLYGVVQYYTIASLGFHIRRAWINLIVIPIAEIGVVVLWLFTGFPLPAVYLAAYSIQAASLLISRRAQMKTWFLINMSFTNIMAVHLIFVSITSLIRGTSMNLLLTDPLWRTCSVSAVLFLCIVEDLIFLLWPGFSTRLTIESDSEEARPFMAFLWFCTGFLLVDSLLCVPELEPPYPPLFLIGSNVVLMFLLVRFLLHINAIILEERQREEHEVLSAKLEAARENAGILKRMADQDALTGVFSRHYIMEKIDVLINSGKTFSIVFMDLDGLKEVNDEQGHDAGDHLLISFAKTLESKLRSGDILARVGGDEFVLLMPGCDRDSAQSRIGEIRSIMENGESGADLRFSYGVASLPADFEKSAEVLIEEADQKMYLDKSQRKKEEA